jgi:hypothetical protein
MPKLRRVGLPTGKLCEICKMMDGKVYIEGTEPPPYPISDYGIPAHKKCLCKYLRFACILCEDKTFLLAEDGSALVLGLEYVPVIWVPPVPDRPDYSPPTPPPGTKKKKKNYIPPFPFGV